MSNEIEKKYLLAEAPALTSLGEGIAIEQSYLLSEGRELRVRKKGETFYMTVKGPGTLSRREWEVEIPEWVYEALRPAALGRIEKTRFELGHDSLTLELDQYHGALAGLWTLECEFESEEQAKRFEPPPWAAGARDVTADARFKNRRLAQYQGSAADLRKEVESRR